MIVFKNRLRICLATVCGENQSRTWQCRNGMYALTGTGTGPVKYATEDAFACRSSRQIGQALTSFPKTGDAETSNGSEPFDH